MSIIRQRIDSPSVNDICNTCMGIQEQDGLPALCEVVLSNETRKRWIYQSYSDGESIAPIIQANQVFGVPIKGIVSTEDFAEVVAVHTGRY